MMNKMFPNFLCITLMLFHAHQPADAAQPTMTIVIRSQPNSYHIEKADRLQRDLEEQIEAGELVHIDIVQAHREWPDDFDKAWAILPIFSELANSQAAKRDWIMFIEDGTVVNLEKLLQLLNKYKSSERLFLGRGLFDKEMTIIHHFHHKKAKGGKPFLFPDFEAGWLLSSSFLKQIGDDWVKKEEKADFQIDLKHEVAMYINNTYDVELTHVPELCGAGEEDPKCVTNVISQLPDCGDSLGQDDVFVGVKTTLMFHKDRLKVVGDTWGPKFKNLIMYSNISDPEIPTVDCGVPNTARGHCGKTDFIMKDFLKRAEMKNFKWLIIADDDTIMSAARMIQLLNCYDHEEKIFLGEKYGYALHARYGYGYITGGGGMVFSRPAVQAWVDDCNCPSIDTPDDMYLGQCLFYRSHIVTTHSPLFHQARPDDYAEGYLSNQTPVSFHKHWMVDPMKVYRRWFEKADADISSYSHKISKAAPTTPPPQMNPEPLPPTPLENPIKDEL